MGTLSQRDNFIPPKWIKHKILTIWNLRDDEELNATIHRYHISDYEECLKKIEKELSTSAEMVVYIIKLVYRKSVYKLPNFMIRSREDIALCRDKLKNIKEKQVIEIWYCKNVLDREKVYGRMQFSLDELFPRIVVRRMEIVWGDSARMIERYPNLDCAFAAVEIAGWGKNFRVIDMIQADKSKTEIKEMIDMLLNILSNYQSRIINLGEFVNESGCLSLCIEFSYTKEGKFTIIDWDSDNDMNVINKISHEQVLV